jgi:hypothetical protein
MTDAYRQLMKHAQRLAQSGHGELAQFLRDTLEDAARYRYLREHGDEKKPNGGQVQITYYDDEGGSYGLLYEAADASVDAAIAARKP